MNLVIRLLLTGVTSLSQCWFIFSGMMFSYFVYKIVISRGGEWKLSAKLLVGPVNEPRFMSQYMNKPNGNVWTNWEPHFLITDEISIIVSSTSCSSTGSI